MAGLGVYGIDRGLWDDPDFADESYTEKQAWAWMIGATAWKEKRFRHEFMGPVCLARGEFCYSVRFLADKWHWSKSRVARFLVRLEKRDTIRDVSRDGIQIYSLRSYNKFQIVGLPVRDTENAPERDDLGTTLGRPRDKEKEGKKKVEEKNLMSDCKSDASNLDGLKVAKKSRYTRDFEDFWKLYPTDRNMSKLMAFKQWAKLSEDDRRAAIAAVPGYRYWASKQRDYRTLHGVRFLSQRRFDGFAPPPGVVLSIEEKRIRDAEQAATDQWEAELEAARIRQGA